MIDKLFLDKLLLLDFNTALFLVCVLTVLLSLSLAFARVHAKGVHGLGHLAIGNLLISLGYFLIFALPERPYGYKIIAVALIAAGKGFYFNGINALLGGVVMRLLPLLLFLGVLLADGLCMATGVHLRHAMMLNSLVYLLTNASCAVLLLTHKTHKNSSLRFTAAFFLGMCCLLLVRIASLGLSDAAGVESLTSWSMNKLIVIWASIFQLGITFGFLLMLNYRMGAELMSSAAYDWLTGVLNRRYLEDMALKLEAHCERTNIPLSVMLLDLDHFKKINDVHGHQAGDEVLKHFALHLKTLTRDGDLIGRYGGEEFCLLMPDTSAYQASLLAERIREALDQKPCLLHGQAVHYTVSIGVSDSYTVGFRFAELVAAADKSLYRAKEAGRDQTICYEAVAV